MFVGEECSVCGSKKKLFIGELSNNLRHDLVPGGRICIECIKSKTIKVACQHCSYPVELDYDKQNRCIASVMCFECGTLYRPKSLFFFIKKDIIALNEKRRYNYSCLKNKIPKIKNVLENTRLSYKNLKYVSGFGGFENERSVSMFLLKGGLFFVGDTFLQYAAIKWSELKGVDVEPRRTEFEKNFNSSYATAAHIKSSSTISTSVGLAAGQALGELLVHGQPLFIYYIKNGTQIDLVLHLKTPDNIKIKKEICEFVSRANIDSKNKNNATSRPDYSAQLSKYYELFRSGALTEEEFSKIKAEFLGSGRV